MSTFATQSAHALRLYGLYGSKKLGYFFSALLCLVLAAEVYVLIADAPNGIVIDIGASIGSICGLTNASRLLFIW